MTQEVLNPFDDFLIEETTNQDCSEEPMWDALIGKIIEGKVIPIIGPDFLTDGPNIHVRLLDAFIKRYGVKSNPTSFSDLVFDKDYLDKNANNRDSVYSHINIFATQRTVEPSQLLVELLETKLFPFVITTSFLPVVEQTMARVWEDRDLRVLNFNNNPGEIRENDINNSSDLLKPTIFYMFGRAGDPRAHSYVVTDQDMLDFCSSWLSGEESKKPKRLIDALGDKFLLMLGTDYSDWLFRFVWYAVRKESALKSENNDLISSNVELEDSFVKFMKRNNTFLKNNPAEVIRQIKERMDRQYAHNPSLKNKIINRVVTKFSYPEVHTDVFISYSRRDSDVVEKLYEALTAKGLNVWYDKYNLTAGGNFMAEIRQAIKTTQFFVPILSQHITTEAGDDHVYRAEWESACKVHKGYDFIIPVSEQDFDFYHNKVEEKIQECNAVFYRSIDDMDLIAEKIYNKYHSIKF